MTAADWVAPRADVWDWGLLEPLGHTPLTSDDSVLAAMVKFESMLADAWGDPSLIGRFDWTALDRGAIAAGARRDGNPVNALVDALRAQAGNRAEAVHKGATSQDVLDSALMFTAQQSVNVMRGMLSFVATSAAGLADAHRSTLMAGRTLSQHAGPTTFGVRAASWLSAITDAAREIDRLEFPVQLGGSVGTASAIAALGGDPAAIRTALAANLGLTDPGRSWHTDRTPIARIASAVGIAIGVLGRVGADLVSLSSTEVGELRTADAGLSSAMPQKRNPVTGVLLVSAARRSPFLVATLLGGLESVDERPSGAWHAEWMAFRELLDLGVSSSMAAQAVLQTVDVDVARMRANLEVTGDGILAESRKIGDVDGFATAIAVAGPIVDAAIQRFRSIE